MSKKIIITEEVPDFFTKTLVNNGFEVDLFPSISYDELSKIISKYYGILIRGRIILDKKILSRADNLKIILRPGSGLDIIDISFAGKKNIEIINSPEGNRDSVAEHAMGLILGLLNHIPKSFAELQNFQWTRSQNIGQEIQNMTIGLIGYGNTGSAFAKRLSSFDVSILAFDKYIKGYSNIYVRETRIEEIFEKADILSLHIPYTEETHHLVNKEFVKRFKKSFYLINTSRGKIIRTSDLLWALESGLVLGAVLDVLENEKLNNLTIAEKNHLQSLFDSGKVIITPHIAGLSIQSERKIFQILLNKLLK